jgi:hypothetical protein
MTTAVLLIEKWLNAAGLVLNMIGVVIIFIWGPPQPSFEGEAYGPAESKETEVRREAQRKRYRCMSKKRVGTYLLWLPPSAHQ